MVTTVATAADTDIMAVDIEVATVNQGANE
jgi:hypothetical protein